MNSPASRSGIRSVEAVGPDPRANLPGASVIICAHTLHRWDLLGRAVASARTQTVAPREVIVCIDHNEELLARARARLAEPQGVPVVVVANQYDGRLGSARTTAVEVATGDVVAFLDDDACAESTWLERLLVPYQADDVMAVGGAPVPEYARERPRWLPPEFNWVFGCAYTGLPESQAPIRRLIGASMSVRRDALLAIGGFHSDNHDDMDMCHRLLVAWPGKRLLYEPRAVVRHHVGRERLTWAYFWRRCFFVNRGKAAAHSALPEHDNRAADRQFVARALTRGAVRELRTAAYGDPTAFARLVTLVAGVVLAGAGYLLGTMENAFRPNGPRAATGVEV